MSQTVIELYNPAMRSTPSPAVGSREHIVVGHLQEGKDYAVWREHGSQDWLLVLTLKGEGQFIRLKHTLSAQAGEMVLLRPNVTHDYRTDARCGHWELLWAHFMPSTQWFNLLHWPEVESGLMRLQLSDSIYAELTSNFFDVLRFARSSSRNRHQLAMNAFERLLLRCDETNPHAKAVLLDTRVRKAMDFLCQNFEQPINLTTLSEHCQVSNSRLSHLFREQVGQTPRGYLEEQRLQRAKQLLSSTQWTIAKIAYNVGFDNPFNFSRRFKSATTMSPKVFREKFRR